MSSTPPERSPVAATVEPPSPAKARRRRSAAGATGDGQRAKKNVARLTGEDDSMGTTEKKAKEKWGKEKEKSFASRSAAPSGLRRRGASMPPAQRRRRSLPRPRPRSRSRSLSSSALLRAAFPCAVVVGSAAALLRRLRRFGIARPLASLFERTFTTFWGHPLPWTAFVAAAWWRARNADVVPSAWANVFLLSCVALVATSTAAVCLAVLAVARQG